jgi:DNA-binding MarR family transcriptional regulator
MVSEAQRNGRTLEPLADWMGTLIGYVQSARPDLTNRQMALLMLVYLTDGPHTVRGLAAKLRVSKPVVTRALNTLGALGYLRRQKDESDLRNIFVERTQTGHAFLEEFAGLIERAEKDGANRQRGKSGEPRTTH